MKDLEEQQQAMRERNKRLTAKRTPATQKSDAGKTKPPAPASEPAKQNELEYLRRRISALEKENAELRRAMQSLQQNSARPEKSYDQQRREQQHNFFKYSNINRY